jgi:hypothetical protein
MPGNLEPCHPFCQSNPVTVWPGAKSRYEVHYLSGWVYERRFERWIDGVGYDLEIGGHGEATSLVSWRVEPVERAVCTLGITVSPHLFQNAPVVVRWAPHILCVAPCSASTSHPSCAASSGTSSGVNRRPDLSIPPSPAEVGPITQLPRRKDQRP